MPIALRPRLRRQARGAARWLREPQLMVFLPAATLAAFWLGGERMLLLSALGLPLLFAVAGAFRFTADDGGEVAGPRGDAADTLDRALAAAAQDGRTTGCLVVLFDDAAALLDRHGRSAQSEVIERTAARIAAVLRPSDAVIRLEGGGFAVALGPVRRLDLETMVQLAARLQGAAAEPVSIEAARIYVTCSVGFCLATRAPAQTGAALLDAAQIAADEALRHGPVAIRGFSADMARRRAAHHALRDQLEVALDEGQIIAHFQPQISADTGAITGFETLARWQHPERGLLNPVEFLPAVEDAGLSDRLSEVMLYQALAALAQWDRAGLHVPTVGVNFSADELRNPRLADRLKWELDRFDLAPERLSVEILETVAAQTDNDVIVNNVAALARMGCGIDLDDFGTGHTSITNIRRFAVRRLKIDRSFVTRLDEDREQQRIVAAILSLAERLGLDTLAEGVETRGEHAMLAQLGCGHLQGFGIARPMPLADTDDWIRAHSARIAAMPRIGQRAGKG
ncbi:putative bifunctional diguanylate cyclase/phosphodiesterase [Ruixingdingia sedimenti]|uniref:GGDEF domain-containing phosphodiesterase n=1 Tax=Ruixingdingia sedimenti TaxID=3073604 RepID=A0ABU1FD12_9RHOB|nr:GGDEF domain-containing phosphodiesterase [Xinfangfangia sp. LG-4]MDR5654777.1 GGDEF domain-containing phosphodiesterase [Xinfangfangia sp. LG-4]